MMRLCSPSHKHCKEHMMLQQQHREKGRPAGNTSNTIQAIVHKPKKGGQQNSKAFGYLEKKFLYQISFQQIQKHHLRIHTILQMTWMRELLSQKRQVSGILGQILQFISTEVSEREEAHQRREASQAGDPQSSPDNILDDLRTKLKKLAQIRLWESWTGMISPVLTRQEQDSPLRARIQP